MEKWEKVSKKRSGFTIVELLTVMSVIAILIGLLVPALNLVQDYANELQQRAQLHSIGVAIDMFVAESGYGTYPASNDNYIVPQHPQDPSAYCGANKLAEAVVGWDQLGYHPDSDFRSDGMYEDATGTPRMAYGVSQQNLEERRGPFIDLENAQAFRLDEIYEAGVLTAQGFTVDPLIPNYVLCDVYEKKRTLKKTGMPILYYRARTQYFNQDYNNIPNPPATTGGNIEDDIYYYRDNESILLLGKPEDSTQKHPIADGQNDWLDFENKIRNDDITTVSRPYRAGSYILLSAGKDGLYGTADDIMNFKKE